MTDQIRKLRWLGRLCVLAGVVYAGLSFWQKLTLTCACAPAPILEAKMVLGSMGRAQQWRLQEQGAFTPDWQAMEPVLGVPDESENYRFSLQLLNGKLYGFAIAKEPLHLRHVVTVLASTEETAESETQVTNRSFVMCVSETVGEEFIPLPIYNNDVFECSPGTVAVY